MMKTKGTNTPAAGLRTAASTAALAGLLLLGAAAPAEAQRSDERRAAAKDLVFSVELPSDAARAVTDPDNMSPSEVAARLARSARVVYRGEEPVKARFLALFVTAEGDVVAGAASDAVALEPGRRAAERSFPDVHFDGRAFPDVHFDGRAFPDVHFQVRAFPDGYFDEGRFPDSAFDPRRFPDTRLDPERFPDSSFSGLRLRKGQGAIILAVVPADPDVYERATVHPAGAVVDGED